MRGELEPLQDQASHRLALVECPRCGARWAIHGVAPVREDQGPEDRALEPEAYVEPAVEPWSPVTDEQFAELLREARQKIRRSPPEQKEEHAP